MQKVTGKALRDGIQYETLRELILDVRERYAGKDAFIFRKKPEQAEIHKTYDDFGNDVEFIGLALAEIGVSGEHLSVVGENSYEWMVSYAAIVGGGSVGVPLDRLLPETEVINLLKRGKVRAIFYHPKHHEMMLSVSTHKEDPDFRVQYYICMDKEMITGKWPKNKKFLSFSDLLEKGKKRKAEGDRRFLDAPIDPDEMKIILFTSGTTSMSKGVMLSHKNICKNVYYIATTLLVETGERAFSILPLHHTFENTCDFFLLSRGCVICFSDGLRYLVKNFQEWHIEVVIAVPLLFESVHAKIMAGIEESGKGTLISIMIPITRFLRKIGVDIRRKIFKDIIKKLGGHLRMVVIGGAGIDKKYIRDFNDFGLDFLMGYGLTETAPVISVTTQDCNVYGSVGLPVTDVSVGIDTESTKPGAIGEILSKSDCIMLGYYENPEATAEVMTGDGWFRTGDMGYLDKKGCLFITGRVKSMIVLTNGKKAFPEEIESLINVIPGVREAFVWGDETEKESVAICAKILIDRPEIGKHLPVPDKLPGDNNIQTYFRERIREINHQMPSYKAVRYFVFSEGEMVKTTTLKVRRKQELAAVHAILEKAGVTMKTAHGQNLDTL
ncbi:MAG: AMP-binding protein [Clostridiaceae bacterium]|nr:AMP-binding protein [Clostridiaceae bacterium]